MFPNLSKTTSTMLGDPIKFWDGTKSFEVSGILRNPQDMKQSKDFSLRSIDQDFITMPSDNRVVKGMRVECQGLTFKVSHEPARDGSGGMIVRLDPLVHDDVKSSQHLYGAFKKS